MSTKQQRRDFLKDAASRKPGDEVTLTIRQLLAYWNAQRRGYWYVKEIDQDLKEHRLVSSPPFTDGWVDNTVRLVPERELTALDRGVQRADTSESKIPSASQETESALMAGGLTFVELDEVLFGGDRPPPIYVSPNDSLPKAQSLMMRYDHSQLPVMTSIRNCTGAVSWESIAQTLLHKPDAKLMDCIIPVDQLSHRDDVLSNIPKITKNGFVVTKDDTGVVVGVVTTADLSSAFEELSGPFLLIGIAERKLRQVAESHFDNLTIKEPVATASVLERSVESLTLGELKTLFDSDPNWDELDWPVDKSVFRGLLGDVLMLRNRVMHFRREAADEEGLRALRNLIRWLAYLVD